MLENMLMRPIERPVFDKTREWLAQNPSEKFLIVLDEAHLYRGAAGAEVGLLIRRLRDRLNIPPERFQVICATASFKDANYAPDFGAQLTGVPRDTFMPIQGDLAWRAHAAQGTKLDAEMLSNIDLAKFYDAESDEERAALIKAFLEHRRTQQGHGLETDLYRALAEFPPLGLLINNTMKMARPVEELGRELFPDVPMDQADLAATVLMALGTIARLDPKAPGLLPCRIHNFFRGLPGLWVCMDEDCTELADDERSGICGKMYSQPRERCECGARVHEFFTCRFCGTGYAFPTDVATFHVFDQGRSSRFRPIMRFAPSQGLPIALSQYAPGKQIWVSGKCYSSGAVYSMMAEDRYQAWEAKRLYCECSACGFARTFDIGEIDRGDTRDCPACGTKASFGEARYWLRPPGFAHPVDVEEVMSPDDMPETSYATRAKLTMQTPSEESKWTQVNERVRVLKERKHLLVSNTGPKRDGYSYCVKCGRIEASSDPTPLLSAPHRKPFPDEKEPTCEGAGTTRHIVLGTDYITDIALFSLEVAAPLRLRPAQYPTDVALRTVSEALAKAASELLEIEPGELMAEYRPSLTPEGQEGLKAEIFLYDTLPGGAGFASQLVDHGVELLQRALQIVRACPENCDASCYRCLRSFKNKFEHRLLDRHVAAELLEYLLTGTIPEFSEKRLANSTALLYNDLLRQSDGTIEFETDVRISAKKHENVTVPILAVAKNGARFVIALSGPLTSDYAANESVRLLLLDEESDLNIIVINELLVRGNLPAATREVQQQMAVWT